MAGLSTKQRDIVLSQINEAENQFLKMKVPNEKSIEPWESVMRKNGVSYYSDPTPRKSSELRFCFVGHTSASVESVIDLFTVENEVQFHRGCKIVYGKKLLDARLGSVLISPTEAEPHRSVYVRYTSFKSPKLLRSNRDAYVTVATNVKQTANGATFGYCVWDSLDDPRLPHPEIPHNNTRSRFHCSGYYVYNSGQVGAVTRVAYIVNVEPGGALPNIGYRLLMPALGSVVGRICAHFRHRQINSQDLIPREQMTPTRSKNECQRCEIPFKSVSLAATMTKSDKYNCSVCGCVVCRGCHEVVKVEVFGEGKKDKRICTHCLHDMNGKSSNSSKSAKESPSPVSSGDKTPVKKYSISSTFSTGGIAKLFRSQSTSEVETAKTTNMTSPKEPKSKGRELIAPTRTLFKKSKKQSNFTQSSMGALSSSTRKQGGSGVTPESMEQKSNLSDSTGSRRSWRSNQPSVTTASNFLKQYYKTNTTNVYGKMHVADLSQPASPIDIRATTVNSPSETLMMPTRVKFGRSKPKDGSASPAGSTVRYHDTAMDLEEL